MAQSTEQHLKLLIGDLAVQLAVARAEIERLTEQVNAAPADQGPMAEVRPFPDRQDATG